jgi:hypothetical protein
MLRGYTYALPNLHVRQAPVLLLQNQTLKASCYDALKGVFQLEGEYVNVILDGYVLDYGSF